MPQKLKLAVAQSRTENTTADTLQTLQQKTLLAATSGVDLILFPEAYLGGYPRTCNFGVSVGDQELRGRDQFLEHFKSAVDLGDTPAGAGDAWVGKTLPIAKDTKFRGDGTREALERIARDAGVFIVTGLVEKAGGSLYSSVLYVCPQLGVLGKRRKVIPTGTEKLIWAQGSPSTLRAVTTTIKGVKLTFAAAVCWESYMPMLRQSLYSQNVNLYLAPTADSQETWLPLMRTVGFEGRTFVLSANQCVKRKHLPKWITQSQAAHAPASSTDGIPPLTRRRTSTITKDEDGHEICWPSSDAHQPDLNKAIPPKTNGIVDESQSHPPHHEAPSPTRRRHSIITETPEHHEICWPSGDAHQPDLNKAISPKTNGIVDESQPHSPHHEAPSPTRRRHSIITETPEHHEICWPQTKITENPICEDGEDDEEFVSRGGSCIISPLGDVLAGPIFDVEDPGLLIIEADFDDCERARLDLDVAVSRNDAFKLTVEGLDLDPPP